MKRRHLLLVALSLILSICMCFCLASCSSCDDDPVALATPVVNVDNNGVASWAAVENASGYAYKIDNGEEKATDNTSVTLTDGQSVVVKAVGDGKSYSDSEWSTAKTYTKPAPQPVKLGTPVVTVNDEGVASWAAIPNATKYVYKIDNGNEQETTQTSVTLTDGQSIVVKAVGNGTTYLSGDFSVSKTYTAGSQPSQPVQLGAPTVTVGTDGTASWAAIEHATAYEYKINDGTEIETQSTSVNLTDGDKIVVRAVGDGTNYKTSGWSEEKTYNAGSQPVVPVKLGTPAVTISDTGLASWAAVPNATKYTVKIGDTETDQTELTKQLTDGQTIQVKAVGDGTNYTTGDYSTVQTYNAGTTPVEPVKLGTPVVTISDTGLASWAAVPNATKYTVKIGDTETDQTELTKQLTDGQSIQVKAVGDGTNYATGDYSTAQTYTATVDPQPVKLMAPTVEVSDTGLASWKPIDNASKYAYKINDGEEQETTELSVQLLKGQKILVKAVGDGENYLDSNFSAARSYIVSKLAASISFEDSANRTSQDADSQVWTQNGITFTNEKAESTTNVSNNYNPVRLYKDSSIKIEYANIVKIVFNCNSASYATALNSSFTRTSITHSVEGKVVTVKFNVKVNSFEVEALSAQVRLDSIDVYVEKVAVTLDVPVVTIDEDGNATWIAIPNATKYSYVIGDATPVETQETRVPLLDNNATIKVMAVGDGDDYANSAYSEEKTYIWTTVQLDAPTVTINNAGKVSWNSVDKAVKYVYVIDDGAEQETTECELSTFLTDGQSIKVKTIGERRYLSSDFCEPAEYTAPTESTQLRKDLIEVTIARDGTVSVTHPNASSFKYKVNDGTETDLALNATFSLTSGQSVTVKAVGDGTIYTDSEYTEAVTYTAPKTAAAPSVTLTIEGTTAGKVTASWNAVTGATKYAYVVNGGTPVETQDNTVIIDLDETGTFKVKAIGDTNTATDGNFGDFFNDSEYCTEIEFDIDNEKTYTVAEIAKIATYYGSTTDNKPTTDKVFTVSGKVSTNTAYNTLYSNIDITLKQDNVEFVIFRATFADGIGSTTTAADELKNYTVTATGVPMNFDGKLEFNSGCTVTAIEISAADRVAYAKEDLTLNDTYVDDFELPLTGKYGTVISWAIANDNDVSMSIEIDTDGKTVTILQDETDVEITLTATITYGEDPDKVIDTKDITFTIPAEGSEPSISWVKVTSADDLKAGDIIILTYINGTTGVAMGAQSGTYRSKVDLTMQSGTPDLTKDGIVTITLEATQDDTYKFALKTSDSSKYLSGPTTKNQVAEKADASSDNSMWKISITSAGIATVEAKAGTTKVLQYNASSPRFACYAGTQQNLTIYKQVIT